MKKQTRFMQNLFSVILLPLSLLATPSMADTSVPVDSEKVLVLSYKVETLEPETQADLAQTVLQRVMLTVVVSAQIEGMPESYCTLHPERDLSLLQPLVEVESEEEGIVTFEKTISVHARLPQNIFDCAEAANGKTYSLAKIVKFKADESTKTKLFLDLGNESVVELSATPKLELVAKP